MKKSMIYTRTGDKGTTSLVGGVRVPKIHVRIEAYGTVDELSAHLGMLIAFMPQPKDACLLNYVQHKLFTIGSYLATDQSSTRLPAEIGIDDEAIHRLEQAIDELDAALPPLRAFVLPGGSQAASICHVCRTVCRRAERRILALEESGQCPVDENVKRFVNRLSDYLFVLSRNLNLLTQGGEIYWDKSCR